MIGRSRSFGVPWERYKSMRIFGGQAIDEILEKKIGEIGGIDG